VAIDTVPVYGDVTRTFYALSPSSGKRNVTVWRPSVCPSVCLSVGILTVTYQRQHATRPAYILARQKGGLTYLLARQAYVLLLLLFKMSPSHSTRGRIATLIAALTPSTKNFLQLKIW